MGRGRTSAFAAAALILAGCHHDSTSNQCSATNLKATVGALVGDWYLFPEDLPNPLPDPAASATPQDYLDALTKNAYPDHKERHLSFILTFAQEQQIFGSAQNIGFGLGLLYKNTNQLFVREVFPGSPAEAAGFHRGDQIVALGPSAGSLALVSDLLTVDPSGGSVNAALGPSTIGLTVFFQVIPVGSTVPELRQATKAVYSLDPVPPQKLLAIPNTTPQRQAGYVMLRTFAGDSTPNELKAAFAAFRDAGVSDVIIDVRYNGGGLLSIAETLADLLGKDLAGQTMYTVSYNARHAVQAPPASFAALAEAPDGPLRVAFIVTGASASASELVPNALEPYRQNDLALIGSSTYGKPIGQINFKIPDCSLDVFLISFQLENKQGDGSYFDGLPDAAGQFSSPTCAADDDLTHPVGDPNEASTAQALSWLANTTTCTPIPPRTGPVASAGALEIAPSLPPPTYASTPDLPGVW